MRILVVTHPTPKNIKSLVKIRESDFVIAVDQATKNLFEQKIKIDLAVGDFDSLDNHEILKKLDVIRLNTKKKNTDTFQALLEAEKKNPKELYLIGGIGGDRIEHFMIHTMLFSRFPDLIIKDEKSTIFLLKEGAHTLSNDSYNTFIAYPKAILSLKGFEYNLDKYELFSNDPLCISNEIKDDYGTIEVHSGEVIVIISKREK